MPNYDRAVGMRFRVALSLCGCFLAGSLAGCGSGEPFSYVKVNGKASYSDGTPIPAKIRLTFIAVNPPTTDQTTIPRPAAAITNSDGTFDNVTSHTYGDGLIPGKHKVVLTVESGRGGESTTNLFAPEYSDPTKTPIEVDTANLPMEIKVKKP
jgi:hypothetical protein